MAGAERTERGPLAHDLRDFLSSPRELWLAYVVWYVESLGIFSMLYTLVLWLSVDFGYDDQGAANWATAFSGGASICMLAAGFLGDSIGLRRGLVGAFGLLAVGRFLMGFAGGRAAATTGLMVMCVGYACVVPVLNTAFRRYSHPRSRPFAFSIYYVVMNIGAASAGFLVDACRKPFLSMDGKRLVQKTVVLPWVGERTLSAYRMVFLLGAALAAVAFLLTLLLREGVDTEGPLPSENPEPKARPRPPWQIAAEVVREDAFWRFMLLMGLLVFVRMIFQHGNFTLPKYALRELGESFPIGKFQAVNPIAIIFLAPLAAALTRHLPAFRVLLVGSAISATSVFVLVLPASYVTIATFFVLLAIGEALWSPRSYEIAATIAPRGRESSYMGLSQLPFFLGKLGALPMSGWLLSRYCPAVGPRDSAKMWTIIGLTTVLAPILMFLLRGVIDPKAPEGSTPRAVGLKIP